jgi:hypothetical protein
MLAGWATLEWVGGILTTVVGQKVATFIASFLSTFAQHFVGTAGRFINLPSGWLGKLESHIESVSAYEGELTITYDTDVETGRTLTVTGFSDSISRINNLIELKKFILDQNTRASIEGDLKSVARNVCQALHASAKTNLRNLHKSADIDWGIWE